MERHLRRGNDRQPPVGIQLGAGAEGLHHRLLVRQCAVILLDDDVARGKLRFDIAAFVPALRDQIASVVRAAGNERTPIFLRMNADGIVLRRLCIQNRGQNLIFYANKPNRRFRLFACRRRDNRHRIAHAAQMAVENQPVIRAELRIRLPRLRKTNIRHIVIRQRTGDARRFQRTRNVDFLNHRVGMRTAQDDDLQAVFRRNILRIDGLARKQRGGVLLADALSDRPHTRTSPLTTRFKKRRIARFWLI